MKKILFIALVSLASSCAALKGIKVEKNPAPIPTSKPGLTFGGSGIGPITVENVGYYCDVKGKILTFSNFGETTEKATEQAMKSCHEVHKDGPCTFVACRKT